MFIPIQSEIPKCRKSKIFEHARKSPSDLPTFKCNACGSCCSHIRGIIPKEDREFIKEFAFGKMPVVQLVPVERMTFPLWDWEAKRFMEWQKEANVDANIKPLRAIFDLKSNKAIILTYFMDSETDACPFLGENKCSIYHTKRAYVCRLFPFNRGPFIRDGMQLKDGLFGECGAMEKILPQLPDDFNAMIKFLNEAFPDESFLNAVQNDIVVEWANKTIVDLIRKKIIKPAMNYPYEFLLKRILNAEKIDFMDFLAEIKYLSPAEKETLINIFDNNMDAKEKIKQFLN
ncbi:YkgJ family cysteine cluster protein [Candidatus Woesearchaeota archaeon]|nr:YkgJ family cysteine cluster protein [Candidatus Woesearchaeota archaeon]